MKKNIRSKVVKESLLDYNTLANSLRENTESAVKSLLDEAVRDTYAKLLSEDDDKDYEEDEVEDTESDTIGDAAESGDASTEGVEDADAGMEGTGDDFEAEEGDDVTDDLGGEDLGTEGDEEISMEAGEEEVGDDGEEWADFEKYKVSDDEYDFTNAEDEDIVKVYKLMKNDDQILVHKDDSGNVKIQDNEAGTEYLISLDDNPSAGAGVISDEADGLEDDFENDFEDMNESRERMYELVLEYNSNVGYTDNYQKKDVMTNPGMSEPGKNVNDWDAGVPKGTSKPWSGKKDKANKPFDGEKGKKVEEELEMGNVEECGDTEAPIEEAGHNVGGFVQQNSTSSSVVPNSNGRNARSRRGSKGFKSTSQPRYSGEGVEESIKRKANKIFNENKELKNALTGVMNSLKEAAVTNHNLGMIIKLISENTTSQDEKMEIITRFTNEAKTVDASKKLYESISRDLKKSNKMNITEEKGLTVEGSKKINETSIYKSQDMLDSLDLMHRMMR